MAADDVAIVGAGPAGSWAAWRLARLGARVTIFDASHPREKPCGGGVSGRALDLARPALARVRLPAVAIASVRFEAEHLTAGVPLAAGDDPHGPDLVVVARAAFDAALLDAAVAAGERWLLVCDAAGLVDPITREGIVFALQSADFAADAIASANGCATRYTARLRAEMYPELRRAARLKVGFYPRPFLRLMIEALGRSARVRRVMADLVAGRQPYATLKKRLLRTVEFGLVWKMLMLEERRGLRGPRGQAKG